MNAPIPDSADSPTVDDVARRRALERLRQEQSTFEQRRLQNQNWFRLQIAIGVAAVVIIPATFVTCVWLLADASQSPTIKGLAATALLVDILGLGIAIWKVVLSPGAVPELSPVTTIDLD